MSHSNVLAYDLGGTKVAAGIVSSEGQILAELREPVQLSGGMVGLVAQMGKMGRRLLEGAPQITQVGVASAGPLDPDAGVLLNPTNLFTDGKEWGVVPIVELLTDELELPVKLENDAAAAVLAEHWLGAGKHVANIVILTLGTGLGVAAVADDKLVRAGRGLHPEAGHITLDYNDHSAPCGCGRLGCAEAYLSGPNFSSRMSVLWSEPNLTAEEITLRAQGGEAKAVDAFTEYSLQLAAAIANYCVLYSPEVVALAGGFAHASELYLQSTRSHLAKMLRRRRDQVDLLPEISISKFQDEAGLLGAAKVAFD